jgi:pimeloyl-ACP methyl ester carboxylesterase
MNHVREAREITIGLADLSLAALSWGEEDAPLALLLHGYPDTAWTWRHLGPELAAFGYRAVAPFMRGYAPSGYAPDGVYQVGALGADVIGLAERLNPGRPTVLIGHDWGAISASAAAATRPDLWSSVVTMAVPPIGPLLWSGWIPRHLPLMWRQVNASWYVFLQNVPGFSERRLDKVIPRLWADWSPGYDATEDLQYVWGAINEPKRRTAVLRYYRALLNPLYVRPRYYRHQRRWTQPLPGRWMWLHGERDGCLLADLARESLARLPQPNQHEILPTVGHFMQLEDPTLINGRIKGFIGAP